MVTPIDVPFSNLGRQDWWLQVQNVSLATQGQNLDLTPWVERPILRAATLDPSCSGRGGPTMPLLPPRGDRCSLSLLSFSTWSSPPPAKLLQASSLSLVQKHLISYPRVNVEMSFPNPQDSWCGLIGRPWYGFVVLVLLWYISQNLGHSTLALVMLVS